jgi:uncharacterized protein (TIGR02452 family)
MTLVEVALETLKIVKEGSYSAPGGKRVSIQTSVQAAVEGTKLYRPDDFDDLPLPAQAKASFRIEVTDETTAVAARRLVQDEKAQRVVALNFASARNPGGGFLGGAKAQEEDLARCSALYSCLITRPAYYEANNAEESLLYTDHMIYSPRVPFFRNDQLVLLDEPFSVSIVTAPAPNARRHLGTTSPDVGTIRETLRARVEKVLRVAADAGDRTLILGAWGCGAFRNDPADVAEAFEMGLNRFGGHFDRAVFAVFERGNDRPNQKAFRKRLAS